MFADDVPEEVKRRRNNELLAIQNQISEEDNVPFIGRQVEVLVEGRSKSAERRDDSGEHVQLTGRTMCDRIVVFDGNQRQVGHTLPVSIYDANAHTMFGTVVTQHIGAELYTLGA
jgi:tRNA-2-methylthio-N6-dimethylallyladenosine synthase